MSFCASVTDKSWVPGLLLRPLPRSVTACADIVQAIAEHTALDDEAGEGTVDGNDEHERQQPPEAKDGP